MDIPSYDQWQQTMLAWFEAQHKSRQAVAEAMSDRIKDHWDYDVSPWTLRYHVDGKFTNVSLELARLVWLAMENSHE